ncbi:hypothetical protein CIK74_12955 [Glutamicibacter sp. BW77]|nr:hypothetical protein CIK74_12955 [Glutamicibacter sp. BW77]HBV10611.1 hypothetical protein [Micrococcaceae bacterium]
MTPAKIIIPPLASNHIFTRRTAMTRRATTRETALTGFLFISLGRGHTFGTEVGSGSCEPFGGMFMILFCLKLFSVKFSLLAGERPAGRIGQGENQIDTSYQRSVPF